MKAKKIINIILTPQFVKNNPNTCDGLKYGNDEKEVKKIATCMFATMDVLRAAAEWGADMIITHEPTFGTHMDELENLLCVAKEKKKFLDEVDIPLFRYHDSVHFVAGDKINSALIETAELAGSFDGNADFTFDSSITPRELALRFKEKCGIDSVRVVGNLDEKMTTAILLTGMRGDRAYAEFVRDDKHEIAISGELCEWSDCEPVRDMAQIGKKKAIIILSHVGSERDGMKLLARDIDGKFDGAQAKYFECGLPYTTL